MTKVIDILNKKGKPFVSFELVPPLKGSSVDTLYGSLEPLLEFAPPFINVTCHRDEVEYFPDKDGKYKKLILSKRPGTVAIVAAILRRFNTEVVPHVICGGASKHKIESELLDLHFLGIKNIMALRGDPITGQRYFIAEQDGFSHTDGLVEMINNLNHGQYSDPNVKNGVKTDFCIGVGGYPEKHFESANFSSDIQNLKRKVDAGADYIITQMFFDNQKFYDFVQLCRDNGITVPIIPGLKPISSTKQIEMLPRSFHIDIPEELVNELQKAKSPREIYDAGTQWCIDQSKDLLNHGVPAIHYYTMGRADNVQRIVKSVF